MSLNPNFREEYLLLLKKCLDTVSRSNRYDALFKEYDGRKKAADERLLALDAICTDCELLIDRDTCEIKPSAVMLFSKDEELMGYLERLSELLVERKKFAEMYGWEDELKNHIDCVVAIGNASDYEKLIVTELGKKAGLVIVCEMKREAVKYERELGLTFYAGDVERLEDLFRIRVLYSPAREIDIGKEDNLDERELVLISEGGEALRFKKSARMTLRGRVYIELEILEELKVKKFNYYTVSDTDRGQMLTLEEDDELYEELWALQEKLTVKFW